jgi:hypothetical protein
LFKPCCCMRAMIKASLLNKPVKNLISGHEIGECHNSSCSSASLSNSNWSNAFAAPFQPNSP